MRIGVSGAHRTGKTTLIDELIYSLPTYNRVDEPYYLLEEEGHAFADAPCLEDFELQLERSIQSIAESEGNCIFDRCPSDILAYLISHDESEGFDLHRWLPRVRVAMQQLDLVVFVPIEDPDRVPLSESGHWPLRRRVDEELHGIVLQDQWAFGVPVIDVAGSCDQRARQVLAYIADDGGSR